MRARKPERAEITIKKREATNAKSRFYLKFSNLDLDMYANVDVGLNVDLLSRSTKNCVCKMRKHFFFFNFDHSTNFQPCSASSLVSCARNVLGFTLVEFVF